MSYGIKITVVREGMQGETFGETVDIDSEVDAISEELLSVFSDYLKNLIAEGNVPNIVREIVKHTLIQKTNRDDPNYPR